MNIQTLTEPGLKTAQELYDANPWPRKFTKARKNHQCQICGHRG